MKKYLLDTNICIFLFRNKYNVAEKIKQVGGFENCFISEITLAELKYGAELSENKSYNMALIENFSKEIAILPILNCLNVYAREKARLKKAIDIGLATMMVFAIGACGGEKTVTIGNQIWMAKNLNDASKGGKCYEYKSENCKKYGRLYTWEEATKACPFGWHLPSNAEWKALVSFAGGANAAGGKLKAKSGWEKGIPFPLGMFPQPHADP